MNFYCLALVITALVFAVIGLFLFMLGSIVYLLLQ